MATKEYNPMEPKARKAIKFTDSLVEVVYICESCAALIAFLSISNLSFAASS